MCITCFSKYLGFVHEYSVNSTYYCPYLTTVFAFLPQKHKNKQNTIKFILLYLKSGSSWFLLLLSLFCFLLLLSLLLAVTNTLFRKCT